MLFSLIIFLVTITLLVAFHELGHYSVARWCGVKVERFSIGFGKPLLRWRAKRSGTEFVLSAIPLGGYVKMLGEDETQTNQTPQLDAFNQKKLWQRTAIVLAGPVANFLLACLVYWILAVIGTVQIVPVIGKVLPNTPAAQAQLQANQEIVAVAGKTTPSWLSLRFALLGLQGEKTTSIQVRDLPDGLVQTRQLNLQQWHIDPTIPNPLESLGIEPWLPTLPLLIARVLPDSPAAKAGLIAGDRIKTIDGKKVETWTGLKEALSSQPQQLNLSVERHGSVITRLVYPKNARLGIESPRVEWPESMRREIKTVWYRGWYPAAQKTVAMSTLTVKMLGKMLVGDVSWRSVSGPIGIAQGAGQTARISWLFYLQFFALLSISLGVLNLLPIPLLDGGLLAFYVWEALVGKPVSIQARAWGMRIGISLILGLMLIAFYNDFARLWHMYR